MQEMKIRKETLDYDKKKKWSVISGQLQKTNLTKSKDYTTQP